MIWMDSIGGVARPGAATPRRPVRGGAFSVPAGQAEATEAGAPAAEVSLGGVLALQEAQSGAVADREARRHGQDILTELARLQRALLAGSDDPRILERLADLVENQPPASDPRLRAALDAVRLRARVELARREIVTLR